MADEFPGAENSKIERIYVIPVHYAVFSGVTRVQNATRLFVYRFSSLFRGYICWVKFKTCKVLPYFIVI